VARDRKGAAADGAEWDRSSERKAKYSCRARGRLSVAEHDQVEGDLREAIRR